jgi:hypothetical protein
MTHFGMTDQDVRHFCRDKYCPLASLLMVIKSLRVCLPQLLTPPPKYRCYSSDAVPYDTEIMRTALYIFQHVIFNSLAV